MKLRHNELRGKDQGWSSFNFSILQKNKFARKRGKKFVHRSAIFLKKKVIHVRFRAGTVNADVRTLPILQTGIKRLIMDGFGF